MLKFNAELQIIGVNPFVSVPDEILNAVFLQAGKEKGKIPIFGNINNRPYRQTLVKYSGEWRLYVNTTMLKNSPKRIGETIELTIAHDPSDRTIEPHPKFQAALMENEAAHAVFKTLRPSLQLEIVRYISRLKNEQSVDKNIVRAIDFLLGKGRFVGRDGPYNQMQR